MDDDLNGLKLNQDKTLIHSKFRPRPPFYHVQVGNELIPFSASATNLGVTLDETMSFEGHLLQRNISRIRKYLTRNSVKVLIHAFVTSKLVYCNSLLYGLANALLQKPHLVQNSGCCSDYYPHTETQFHHTCLDSATLAS